METSLSPLLPFFDAARGRGDPLVLATVLSTAGSTYRKSGAQMLFTANGDAAGLLSGGCLEGDLREHVRAVFEDGRGRAVSYDMRGPDDEIWGLGAGCEGAMEIYLQRLSAHEQWQPLAGAGELTRRGERALVSLQIGGTAYDSGSQCWVWRITDRTSEPRLHYASPQAERSAEESQIALQYARELGASSFAVPTLHSSTTAKFLTLPYAPAPALLVLGAGPDARPLTELARFLGWRIVVFDHRSALLEPARFPAQTRLMCGAAEALCEQVNPDDFDAAVVMSHHLATDRSYLRSLAFKRCRFIGLLGPAPRREKLLGELDSREIAALRPRLHAPVGLDLGGRSPEEIALSIVAELQAYLNEKSEPGLFAASRT